MLALDKAAGPRCCFQPLLWQIPAEFCAVFYAVGSSWLQIFDPLDSLQGGAIA